MTDIQTQVAEILTSFSGQECTPALMQSIEAAMPRARGRVAKASFYKQGEIAVVVREPGQPTFVATLSSGDVINRSGWMNHGKPKQ